MTTATRSNRSVQRDEGKTERLEARTTKNLKDMFQRAADIRGQTLTDFMLAGLHQVSLQVIRDHEIIELSGRNREAFLKALENPPAPSSRLLAALSKLEKLNNGKVTIRQNADRHERPRPARKRA